jgi:cytochrome c
VKFVTAIFAGAMVLAGSAAYAQDITGDAEAGEKVFRKCKACHTIEKEQNKVGPHLVGIYGRTAGSVDGYKYSVGLKKFHDEGLVWNVETLTQYLPSPKDMVEKSKMTFKLTKEKEIADVIAYLAHESGE